MKHTYRATTDAANRRGYTPRSYHVVKTGRGRYWVVSEDLADPDVWALINQFSTPADAWAYVRGVEELHRQIAS